MYDGLKLNYYLVRVQFQFIVTVYILWRSQLAPKSKRHQAHYGARLKKNCRTFNRKLSRTEKGASRLIRIQGIVNNRRDENGVL